MSTRIAKAPGKKLPQTAEDFAAMSVEELAALTFGDEKAGQEFLQQPHYRVGGQKLVDAAKTPEGEERVRSLLFSVLFCLPA
jgi:uncharacterized protein (DUF2384 family)